MSPMSERERDESQAEPLGEALEEAACDCSEPGSQEGTQVDGQRAPDEGTNSDMGDECADAGADEDARAEGSDEADGEDSGIDVVSVIEAVLFATDEPITPQKLADIAGIEGVREARKRVEELNAKYEQMACAFRIEEIAGGYQMLTLSQYNPWLGKLVKVRNETKLSGAALETLAIVAYKQPIMRVNIEAIRGVSCGEMVRQLCDKGLVKIVGRAEELGRPLLYGTTKRFLEVFGLSSLRELPQAQELKPPK